MKKTLALLTMFLLVVVSFASATLDVNVASISISPSNPTEGQSISVSVTLENAGDENVTASANGLTLDFDDTTIVTGNVPALLVGETKIVSFSHTYTTHGNYELVATYTIGDDNAANDEATQTLAVAELNLAPVIETIPNANIILGNTFTYQVIASDPNGDAITFSLSGPTGMSISTTGFITWTPTSPVNNANVVVSVSDGQLTTTRNFLVSAKVDKAEIAFVGDKLFIGGTNQAREDSAVATIEVENTGTKTINALELQITNLRNNALGNEYEAFVSLNKDTLLPGEKALATVSITVPEDASAKATDIGKLVVKGTEGATQLTKTILVNLQAESFLEITEIEISVNGKDEGDYEDGDVFDEALEGDEITLEITLENLYSDRDDRIRKVYVEVEDSNWDIEETSNSVDISGDKSATLTVRFTIDHDVDDDETVLVIRAYGEDDNEGFEHYDEWEIMFEIDRERNDVRIKEIKFNREPIDCKATSVTMDVTLRNYGEDDQDEVFIYAYSDKDEFDWNQKRTYISLDSRDETTISFNIPLPKNLKEDFYLISVDVKYDISKNADKKDVLVEVVCLNQEDTKPVTPPKEEEQDIVIVTPTQPTTPPPTTGNVVYGQPVNSIQKFTQTTTYLVLLVILAIAVLAIIVGWAASLGKK